MNLRRLKKMIREEYSNYLNEQEEIGVDVQPDDVDAMGDMDDENAEGTLRDIYDMLKGYFEGEEDMEEPMDEPMDEPEDVEGGEEEEADLEEWNGKNDKAAKTTHGGKFGAAGYKNFSKSSGHTGFGDSKSLNEIKRMKKLANIIK
jgi:hypothetical protein|tara:strand:- start:75 stop:512 length:438 start_codon:yes stop_codon:yes gene_type:complete